MDGIKEWEDIKKDFKTNLFLGNGASIAVHSAFNYASIFEEAKSLNYITDPVEDIFNKFNTEDFELVLRHLWQAKLVNKALDISSTEIDIAYSAVQKALISTVNKIHPKYRDVSHHLNNIYQYMQGFRTVVSLNYDLIVYWAMRVGNDNLDNWFKDCFIGDSFNDDIETLRKPYCAEGTTLIFYPHGNLILARTQDRTEKKIKIPKEEESDNLLNTIENEWKKQDLSVVPVFVCEGTDKHKKIAIENSSYLQFVYREVIPSLQESLVIYGWGISDQDKHILDQIKRTKPKKIAVSVHNKDINYMQHISTKLKDMDIVFFDAASPGCWNNA